MPLTLQCIILLLWWSTIAECSSTLVLSGCKGAENVCGFCHCYLCFFSFLFLFHSQVLLQCFFWSWVIMWMEALSWGWGLNAIGVAELVELDGPFVKLRLTGRFWHERSMVLARVANYLRKRIPVSYHFPAQFCGGEGNSLFNCCLTTIQL